MGAHQNDILIPHRRRQSYALFRIAYEHVGSAELVVNIEYRHTCCNECRIVKHRSHGYTDESERNDRWRMAVHNGLNIRPRFVNFAVNKPFEKTTTAVGIDGI